MLWGKRKCKLWKFRLANICVLQGHPTQRFFNFTFFSFFTFVLPETWKHYHIAIPSLKTDPKIPYNTMWYQKPSESKSSMTTLRIRKCGGSQTSQDLLRLNSMCFQCVVDLLWKCFQCVGFGFKLSNAQIFCRKTNVVEKQENWLETLSFMLFFTEYLQKGNWVQKNWMQVSACYVMIVMIYHHCAFCKIFITSEDTKGWHGLSMEPSAPKKM